MVMPLLIIFAKAGRKTYTSPSCGKIHNIVDQLLDPHKGNGKLLVIDNGFSTIQLLEDARQMWNTQVVATQRVKTAHLDNLTAKLKNAWITGNLITMLRVKQDFFSKAISSTSI